MGGDGKKRVLVVDDSKVHRKVTTLFVQWLGYQVDEVVTGDAAIKAVQQESYGTVLMDYYMPTMDGLEATAAIRAVEPPQRSAAIIALTAAAGPDLRRRCLEAGMNDVLVKPLSLHELGAMLRRWGSTPPEHTKRKR